MKFSRQIKRFTLLLAVSGTACGLSVVGAQPDGETGTGNGTDAGARPDGGGVTAPITDAATESSTDAEAGRDAATAAGTALRFDGRGSYVRAARPVKDDFTLEAWIRTTTSRIGVDFFEASPVLWADVSGQDNDFALGVLNGHLSFGAKSATVVSLATVTTGSWVHVAVVRSKASMKLYVDGVADGTSNGAPAGPLDAASTLDIGGNLVDGHFFEGAIDEVRVWSIARAPADIAATMHTRLVGNETGLAAYWRFDEGTGTAAADSTSKHVDGVLDAADGGGLPAWIPSDAF